MTKRRRTALFLIMTVLFLVTAPSIVLYSQGYRLNTSTWRIAQVGAFYFDVTPSQATIAIDGRVVKTTTRIAGTAFTQSLVPRNYTIQISKEGYHTWEKNLAVFPKQVTEAKDITLFPIDLAFRTLLDSTLAIWMAPNQSLAVLQKDIPGASWELSLWDMERNTESPVYTPRGLQDTVWDVQWAADSSKFLFQVASREQIQSFVQEIEGKRFPLDFIEQDSGALQFAFAQNQIFFVTNAQIGSSLHLADYATRTILQTLTPDIVAFASQNNRLLWLDAKGILWQYNGSSAPPSQVNTMPFPVQGEIHYSLSFVGEEILLQEQKTLYRFDSETEQFEKILDRSDELVLSPDRQKIALTNGSELFVRFFVEQRQQPSHAKNEQIFLTRFSEPIENLQWLNSHYLIFSVGDAIKISEIDNRDRINIVGLARYSDPQLFWKSNSTTLYVWSDANIYASEKLFE